MEYLGNPYMVTAEIAGRENYFISHSSAMDIHQMVTQPQLVVYTTCTKRVHPISVLETDQVDLLRKKLTSTYMLLDPAMPAERKFIARWRLRLNVSPEEIKNIVRT